MNRIALSFCMTSLLLAQTPESTKRIEFEVASIRLAVDDGHHGTDSDKALLRVHNFTLKRLIAGAYQVDMRTISGGPKWVDSDSYDINAKIPAEYSEQRRDLIPKMFQSLLAERFHLVIHRSPDQISGYFLVVAKGGPKLKPGGSGDSNMHTSNTHLKAEGATMEAFAKDLSRNSDIGKPVVDKTRLSGGYNFELDWMPEQRANSPEPPQDDRPSIFTALQTQLGLRLEAARIPISAIVIDHAEKPDSN